MPLLFIVLGAILALFVTGYAAMSHHITNAGAFYAYVSKGIGKVAGVGTAFVALIAYNTMQVGILGLFGAVFAGFMAEHTSLDWQWYTWVFVAIGVIGILGWLRVDLNAKVLAIFLTCEILVVLFFDLVVAADPGPQGISANQWDPSIAFGAGAGAALCFTMAAFVGFESAAIYGEECKNPRRTVARATYIALGITSIFYALSAWMLASAAGTDTVISADALVKGGFTTPDGSAPDPTSILFITLNVQVSKTIADIATLFFCTSLFAASLSFHNAVARYFFALGRAGVLPRAFGADQPPGGAVHRLATPEPDRGRDHLRLLAVRQRPGAAAVHLADEPRGAGGDPAPRLGVVRGRRLLQPQSALRRRRGRRATRRPWPGSC